MSETVTVTALKFHTHQGAAYVEGESYDVAVEDVDNLVAQGMVGRPDAPPVEPKASQPVDVMTTADFTKPA